MTDRDLYEGCALQAVDDKGRVAIPADLRSAVERNSDVRQVVVGPSDCDDCLTTYDIAWSKELHARLDRIERLAIDRGEEIDLRAKKRAFSRTEKVPFDGSGRFVLPSFYRETAKIGKWALFAGGGDVFDIWSPEVLMQTADADPFLRSRCQYLCNQRGVAL